jgi:YVTN family beta-propeller protein
VRAYIANSDNGTVSVVSGYEGYNKANITVGDGPLDIDVDILDDIAYVVNSGSNTTSVLNVTDGNYSNIADIPVGGRPEGIAADPNEGLAYVATDEGIAVLYGTNKQVQVGVSFDLNPFHAGRIVCKDFTVPTNQYVYVDFRTQCTAQANEGFQFSSWAENTGSNSSRTISSSQDDWFGNFFNAFSGNPSPATLNVTKFGSFAANFKELPPAIFFARCVILWLQFSDLILQLDIILR